MNVWNNGGGQMAVRRLTRVATLVMLIAGCAPDTKYVALQRQVQDQREQIRGLEKNIADQRETIKVLRLQLADRTGISQEEMEQLFGLRELIIEGMSGGYDTDRKVGAEGIVLYVQPVDLQGDVVKAPGRIEVSLYDLDNPSDALVFQSYVFETPHLMDELWYGRMWTYHYTLKCPWPPSGPPAHGKLTAKVVFTHHLTGQRLEAQRVVEFALPLDSEDTASGRG